MAEVRQKPWCLRHSLYNTISQLVGAYSFRKYPTLGLGFPYPRAHNPEGYFPYLSANLISVPRNPGLSVLPELNVSQLLQVLA